VVSGDVWLYIFRFKRTFYTFSFLSSSCSAALGMSALNLFQHAPTHASILINDPEVAAIAAVLIQGPHFGMAPFRFSSSFYEPPPRCLALGSRMHGPTLFHETVSTCGIPISQIHPLTRTRPFSFVCVHSSRSIGNSSHCLLLRLQTSPCLYFFQTFSQSIFSSLLVILKLFDLKVRLDLYPINL